MECNAKKHILFFQDKFILLLFALYFILKPFYFWSSGLPQASDIAMTLLISLYVFKKGMNLQLNSHSKNLVSVAFIFIVYVLFVNTIWMLILSDSLRFITTSVFYIYNFLTVLITSALYYEYKERIIKITYGSTLVSVAIQMAIYLVSGGFSGVRIKGGFNNPNQLGYYSVLTLAILLFTSQRLQVKIKWFIVGIFSSAILCFSSLSKAAMLSYTGMLLFYLFSKNKNKKLKKSLIAIFLILVILTIPAYIFNKDLITSNSLFNSVKYRINSIGKDDDDSLESRGYSRIIEYPEYWIFGAGEGEYTRFGGQDIELHSTLGNVQVSYGIVGLGLFVGIIYNALKNDRFRSWYIVTFIMLYGLTHNGIRNSLFWILLSLLAGFWNEVEYDEKNRVTINDICSIN